jgi:hypothetical protein
MFNFLMLAKYHATVMAVVQFIEATVPDDLPGTKKLDMALKAIIATDAKLKNAVPQLTGLIGLAKAVYNQAREVAAEVQAP